MPWLLKITMMPLRVDLQKLQQKGKIRHLGVTNFDCTHLKEMQDEGVRIISSQHQYSILDQRAEVDLNPLAMEYDFQYLCYRTIAGGFLSDRYLKTELISGPLENRSLTKYALIIEEFGGWDLFQCLLNSLREIADTDIGLTVRSRIKYILPAFVLAILAFSMHPTCSALVNSNIVHEFSGVPDGLPMLLVSIFIIYLFLKGKHLIHGLLFGLLFGVCLGLVLGLLPLDQLLSLDLENFTAKSFIIDGINRAVSISFFTILLMGLVATLKAGDLIDRLVHFLLKDIFIQKSRPKHGSPGLPA